MAAAEIIASRARLLAGTWSRQIPPSIRVSASGRISTSVGPAYPGEMRVRHPLFGNRRYWFGPPGAPFLAPAAEAEADAAMARYARKIDDMTARAGFE